MGEGMRFRNKLAYDLMKKIPQMLLERCEFDKADYNLNIIHPPVYDDEEECDDEG